MNKGINLNETDLNLTRTVGRFKFLTRAQLLKIYFSEKEREEKPLSTLMDTLKRRLSTLVNAGIISRVFFFPVATEKVTHPTSAYFFSPQNQKNLQTYLFRRAQASLWEDRFEELPTNSKNHFSPLFLSHEIGLSDFFLSLETGFPQDGYELACWERTSPISKELSKKFTAGGHEYHFNPDGFVSLTKGGRHSFYWIEYDNNTSSRPKYERKLIGYKLYEKRDLFARDLAHLSKKHNLPLADSQIERARFRVLHLTPDEERRDQLFFVALKMESYEMHRFGSLTDIKPEKILSPLWMRPLDFKPTPAELEYIKQPRLHPRMKSYLANMLREMPRISL